MTDEQQQASQRLEQAVLSVARTASLEEAVLEAIAQDARLSDDITEGVRSILVALEEWNEATEAFYKAQGRVSR